MTQPPPEPPRTDLVDKAIAGGLSSIPLVGGVLGVFYENYMQAPYNRRLQQWQRTMTEVVNELAAKYDALPNEDVLLDALINATRAAQATSQQEKLDALRNAVLNSVAPDAPDTDEQARFSAWSTSSRQPTSGCSHGSPSTGPARSTSALMPTTSDDESGATCSPLI
jgi:hypothetical protein